MKLISGFFTSLSQKLLGDTSVQLQGGEQNNCSQLVEKARQDWLAALSMFNNVSERELVDQAIFTLNAAERRYCYLLGEVRKEKLKGELGGSLTGGNRDGEKGDG